MKTIMKTAALFFALPIFFNTAVALEFFDVSKPSIKKATIYVSAESRSSLNRQFVSKLKSMLEASLLFKTVNSRSSSDYSITLGSRVESKDLLVTIQGEKQSTYRTKHFGIRFRNTDEIYLGKKTAQMANRILKEFFGIKGSIGSTLTWSVTEGPRKVIYKSAFGIDNNTPTQITYNFYSNYGASWNKKNDHIIYTSHTDYGTVINIQQIEPLVFSSTEIYKQSGKASSPIWAPDGTFFMTLHVSDQNSDIFQFKMDGSIGGKKAPTLKKIRQLTHNSSIETEPSISPDNSLMAYVSDQTSEPQIYLMNLRTKKYSRVTRKGGYNVSPAFSPNGRYLAYRSIREGISAVYRYELATKKEIKLSPDSIIAEEPTWSPDGSLIVFAGRLNRRAPTKVYYMLASGGDFYRLTKTKSSVTESNPVWGPALR